MLISTLRPGLMVRVATSITGNVKYRTNVLEGEYITQDGEQKARWETERTIRDPKEHEAAVKVRSAVRSRIQGVCIQSNAFGLSCLEAKKDELDAAIKEANAIADDFNKVATVTRILVYINVGRIATDDAQAVEQINKNIRELMDTMTEGLQNLDVVTVRKAANDARALGGMLTDSAKEKVQAAVDMARSAARRIVQAAETGAGEIDRVTIARLQEARTAFLDLDDAADIGTVEPEGRGIDLEPEQFDPDGGPTPAQAMDYGQELADKVQAESTSPLLDLD